MNIALTEVKLRRRPTLAGNILIAVLLALLLFSFIQTSYSFLAPETSSKERLMVVEGWIHDFGLDEAVLLYKQGNYSKIICTGVPIETGSYIQQFKSYPEMTAARLIKMGIPEKEIITAIGEDVKVDRTYASAVALREAFMAYTIQETDLHLVSVGPHGRRSRMLFQKALGEEYAISITCLEPSQYNESNWMTRSAGVRSVLSEWIGYVYAKLFFHP